MFRQLSNTIPDTTSSNPAAADPAIMVQQVQQPHEQEPEDDDDNTYAGSVFSKLFHHVSGGIYVKKNLLGQEEEDDDQEEYDDDFDDFSKYAYSLKAPESVVVAHHNGTKQHKLHNIIINNNNNYQTNTNPSKPTQDHEQQKHQEQAPTPTPTATAVPSSVYGANASIASEEGSAHVFEEMRDDSTYLDDFSKYAFSLQGPTESVGGRLVGADYTPSVNGESTIATASIHTQLWNKQGGRYHQHPPYYSSNKSTKSSSRSKNVQLDPSLIPPNMINGMDISACQEDLTDFSYDVRVISAKQQQQQQHNNPTSIAAATSNQATTTNGVRVSKFGSLCVGTIAEDHEIVMEETSGELKLMEESNQENTPQPFGGNGEGGQGVEVVVQPITSSSFADASAPPPLNNNNQISNSTMTTGKQKQKSSSSTSLKKRVKKWTNMLWCKSNSNSNNNNHHHHPNKTTITSATPTTTTPTSSHNKSSSTPTTKVETTSVATGVGAQQGSDHDSAWC